MNVMGNGGVQIPHVLPVADLLYFTPELFLAINVTSLYASASIHVENRFKRSVVPTLALKIPS